MTDYIARGNFGANAAPGSNFIVFSNLAVGETITDWRVDVTFSAALLFNSTGSVASTAADCLFAWQIVNHGAAATQVTPTNVQSGPWVYAGNMPIRSYTAASAEQTSSQSNIWLTATGGHYLWDPQLPSAASDIYLSLYLNWFNVYGVPIPVTGQYDLRYHGV